MLRITQNKLPIEFDGVIVEIPVNNMSTSKALKLDEFMKERQTLINKINSDSENSSENSFLLAKLIEEIYRICIKEYDLYIKYIEQIPIEYIEQFINELIQTMMGTDKKKQSIPTGSESSKSKTESGSTKPVSKKRK